MVTVGGAAGAAMAGSPLAATSPPASTKTAIPLRNPAIRTTTFPLLLFPAFAQAAATNCRLTG
jgi:hypothetical protein